MFKNIGSLDDLERLAREFGEARTVNEKRARDNKQGIVQQLKDDTQSQAPTLKALKNLSERVDNVAHSNDKAIAKVLQQNEDSGKGKKSDPNAAAGESKGDAEATALANNGSAMMDVLNMQTNPTQTEIRRQGPNIVIGVNTKLDQSYLKRGIVKTNSLEIPIKSTGLAILLMYSHKMLQQEPDALQMVTDQIYNEYKAIMQTLNMPTSKSKLKAHSIKQFKAQYPQTGKGTAAYDMRILAKEKRRMAGKGAGRPRVVKNTMSTESMAERLAVCCASKQAGNEGLHIDREIVELLEGLHKNNPMSKPQHKQLYRMYIAQ
jgi:hypothetical protein